MQLPDKNRISHLIRLGSISVFGGVSIGVALFSAPTLFQVPVDRPGCDTPIPYRIDPIDPRFPLGQKDFDRSVFAAERLWESGTGKDLFVYDPHAAFPIRTLFDDRQKMTYEAQNLEKKVSEYETSAEKIGGEYEALHARYEKESEKLKKDAATYNERLAEYNAEVRKWNELGGAPEKEYEALEKERKKLQDKEESLIKMSDAINELAGRLNTLAGRLNAKSEEVNRNIANFRERYGEPKPFVQGLYTGYLQSIDIFQFEGNDDLRLVLAHEFGHALGIEGHVEQNEASLMYFLMGGQDIGNPELTNDDKAAFSAVCPERTLSKRETATKYLVLTPWERFNPAELFRILSR